MLGFLHGSWDAYSSPATCVVSTLPTEPFLQSHILHFNLSSFCEYMNYFKYGETSMDMQKQFSTQTKVFINTGVVGYFTFETSANKKPARLYCGASVTMSLVANTKSSALSERV